MNIERKYIGGDGTQWPESKIFITQELSVDVPMDILLHAYPDESYGCAFDSGWLIGSI